MEAVELDLQGPHQVGKLGKSREFCDRSGSREKQNTLKNVVVSGKKCYFCTVV